MTHPIEQAADAVERELANLRAKLVVAVEALEKTAATSTPFTIPWTHSVAADTYWKMIDQMKCTARAALAQINTQGEHK